MTYLHENEFLLRLADRFEGFELVELLDIPINEVILQFLETIDENRDFLEEVMRNGR